MHPQLHIIIFAKASKFFKLFFDTMMNIWYFRSHKQNEL